jgi:hypothetical protein
MSDEHDPQCPLYKFYYEIGSGHEIPNCTCNNEFIWIQFAENNNIRKWSRLPFAGGNMYRRV